MRLLTKISGSLVVIVFLFWAAPQSKAQNTLQVDSPLPSTTLSNPFVKTDRGLAPDLIVLEQSFRTQQGLRVTNQRPFSTNNGLYQVRNNKIAVEVITQRNSEKVLEALRLLGFEQGVAFGRMITGFMPINQLSQAETIPDLLFLRAAYRPVLNSGAVTSQGIQALGLDSATNSLGLDGDGIKIGVISDSYNLLGGADDAILSGDLPGFSNPLGRTKPVDVIIDRLGDGTDEGRAMLELIHDVAPQAELAFRTSLGQCDFVQGMLDLKNAGCDIIVDDLLYINEPMFQDGVVAQGVDLVSEQGVMYVSAAGNLGVKSYESEFRNTGVDVTLRIAPEYSNDTSANSRIITGEEAYRLHDFDPGPGVDVFQKVTMQELSELILHLQWASPYASACEACDDPNGLANCPGAESDLDIFIALRDNDLNSILPLPGYGFDINIGRDPAELLALRANAEAVEFYIVIGKWNTTSTANPDPSYIKYVNFGSDNITFEYDTQSATIYGHANAQRAIAVGAVRYDATPLLDTTATYPILETAFYEALGGSSVGGTPILFDKKGGKIEKTVRQKPEICAPQGTNTSFFGHTDYEGDGFPNFFGTSASAPHAAAVMALVLQAQTDSSGLRAENSEILDLVLETAIDMDNPWTAGFDEGFDFATGYGYINPQGIIQALQDTTTTNPTEPEPTPEPEPEPTPEPEPEPTPEPEPEPEPEPTPEVPEPDTIPQTATISYFELIDAESQAFIQVINPDEVIFISDLPTTHLAIVAHTLPDTVGSVLFELSGDWGHGINVENVFPYTAFDDRDSTMLGRELGIGTYTVKATPFEEVRTEGQMGTPLELTFQLTEKVQSFTLIDANTDVDVLVLDPNTVQEINLQELGNALNIRADVATNARLGSMKFELTAISGDSTDTDTVRTTKIENIAPYALFGDRRGNYRAWTPTPGTYQLKATPHQATKAQGNAGVDLTVTFTVIDPQDTVEVAELVVFPNPLEEGDNLHIKLASLGQSAVDLTLALKNEAGEVLLETRASLSSTNPEAILDLSDLGLPNGIYFLEIQPIGGVKQIRRILKN